MRCQSWGRFWEIETCPASGIPSASAFARSTIVATGNSLFTGVAADCSGNVYAAGFQSGAVVSYSSGVSATSAYTSGNNALLVKYNSAGAVLWAKSVTTGSNNSQFNSLTVDAEGNVYVVGSQDGPGPFTYGGSLTLAAGGSGNNPVLIKFDSNGKALWGTTLISGYDNASFHGLALDHANNIYAAGYQRDTGEFDYGSGVKISGTAAYANALLVKYDATGKAQWAKTTIAGFSESTYNSVTIDGEDKIYVAGYQNGGGFDYGSGNVPADCGDKCSLLVRYDTAGNALWANSVTTTTGIYSSTFNSVTVDRAGNIYAAGNQHSNNDYIYGGLSVSAGVTGQFNMVVVRFSSSGQGIWGRSVTAGSSGSLVYGLATDRYGNIYAAGYQIDTGTFGYGNGVTAQAAVSNANAAMVKYDSSGNPQWARTVTSGASGSELKGIAVDAAGNVYAGGSQALNGSYTYGSAISTTGGFTSGNNAVLLKFTP
ncbi:MAG: hypothetical protein KF713_19900 [Turneriella sp.]|nr:hypothetical protein [Turneriella sp.]